MNRKKRSDRNHVIYEIVNTNNGKSYIGITAAIGRRFHYSAKLRLQKHFSRARREDKQWALYIDMREHNEDVYDLFIVDVVRGKALAHQIEVELLNEFQYELNSTH
jgi:predicted GIY-YIG superfamily endonuclease